MSADVDALVHAWSSSIRDIRTVGGELDEEQWLAPTACPGWNVADIVAHVVDVESALAGQPRPAHEPAWDALPHVQSDVSRWTEVGVDLRRGRPQEAVLAELDHVIELREGQLAQGPHELSAEVPGLFGAPMPLGRLLQMRVFDTWVHAQDIRDAVGMVDELDGPGAKVTAAQLMDALPRIWGKSVGAPVGSVLEVDVTGPGVVACVQVEVGTDGRANRARDRQPDVRISASWPALMHRMAGRIRPGDPSFADGLQISGDQALIERLLPALNIAP